jgi:hypothetical protein
MADQAMNPGERVLRARLGAYAMHGRNDARETTAKARAAFLARFERLADPEGAVAGGRAAAPRPAVAARLLRPARARLRQGPPRPPPGGEGR